MVTNSVKIKYKKTNQIQTHLMIRGMYGNLAELIFYWSDVDMFFANTANLEDRFAICTAIYLAIWNAGKVI
jgi:hypothetical protein